MPPLTDEVIDPFEAPQVALTGVRVITMADGWVTVAQAVFVQPLASVTVTQ